MAEIEGRPSAPGAFSVIGMFFFLVPQVLDDYSLSRVD